MIPWRAIIKKDDVRDFAALGDDYIRSRFCRLLRVAAKYNALQIIEYISPYADANDAQPFFILIYSLNIQQNIRFFDILLTNINIDAEYMGDNILTMACCSNYVSLVHHLLTNYTPDITKMTNFGKLALDISKMHYGQNVDPLLKQCIDIMTRMTTYPEILLDIN